MAYLLDTNACIEHLRTGGKSLLSRNVRQLPVSQVKLCSIVISELIFGARRSQNVQRNVTLVGQFIAEFASLPFDDQATKVDALVRAELESTGLRIGTLDSMIAAIAIANDLVLVTHNTSEFQRISQLKIEDWQ